MRNYHIKSLIVIGFFLLINNSLFSQENSIIISEYINSGNNKAIELYNADDAIYELESYALVYDNNKDSIFSSELLYLSDTLFAGQTFVIASINSDQIIKDKADLLVDSWFTNLDIGDQLVLLKHGEIFDWFLHPVTVPVPTNYKTIRDSYTYWAEDTLLVESFSTLWHSTNSTDYSTLGNHSIHESGVKSTDIDDAFIYTNLIPENIAPQPASFTSSLAVSPSIPTGGIQVSYPIYTFKLKNYQLPISLNYTSSGVRVMDVADWVGLGWNVNTGGVIVRNTRGYPDEYRDFYESKKLTSDWEKDQLYKKYVEGYLYCGDNYTYDNLVAKGLNSESVKDDFKYATFRHSATWVYDSEPDEFSFSCGGYSGKFYFNPDGTIEVASNSNISVTCDIKSRTSPEISVNSSFSVSLYYTLESFTITTPDGVQYKYGTADNSIEYRTDYTYNSMYSLKAKGHTGLMSNIIKSCGYYFLKNCKIDFIFPTSIAKFVNVKYFDEKFETNTKERYKKKNKIPYAYKWFLSEIITPLNETISLNYQSGDKVYDITSFGESVASMNIGQIPTGHLKKDDLHFFEDFDPPWNNLFNPFAEDEYSSFNNPSSLNENAFVSPKGFAPIVSLNFSHQRVKYTPKYVSSIVASNGYSVDFKVNSDPDIRIDMPGAKRLEEIEINYNLTKFKTVELGYTQYSSSETAVMPEILIAGADSRRYQFPEDNDDINDIIDASRHRLFLSSVTEYNELNQSLPAYEFNYFNSVEMPRRISHHRSIGGFFQEKSKVFNSELYETNNIKINGVTFNGINLSESKYNIVSGNSDALPSASAYDRLRVGLLNNVKFPTGMQKDIQYDFNSEYGASVNEIKTFDSSGELKLENYSFTYADSWYKEKYYKDKLNLGHVERNIYEIESIPGPNDCDNDLSTQISVNNKKYIASYDYDLFQQVSSSYSIASRRYGYGSPAIYKNVEISTKHNGSTVLKFLPHTESNPQWYDQDFEDLGNTIITYQSITNDNTVLAGSLNIKEVRNQSGLLVASEKYEPLLQGGDRICNGITPYRLKIYEGSDTPVKKYYGAVYWNSNKWAANSSVESSQLLDNGVTKSVKKTFTYDTDLKLKIEDRVEYDDTEYDHVVTKYSGEYQSISATVYPSDEETVGLYYLKERDVLNAPVEKLYYKNGEIIGGSLVTYRYYTLADNITRYARPRKEYKLIITEPVMDDASVFTHSKIEYNNGTGEYNFIKDSRYELVRTYDSYDNKSNISQYHDEYNLKTSFIWDGEYDQYNTAQVINASSFEIYYNSFEYEESTSNLSNDAHSGKYSFKVNPLGYAFSEYRIVQNRTYKLSAWVKTESNFNSGGDHANLVIKVIDEGNQIDEITCSITETNGKWKLFETMVDLSNYTNADGVTLELLNANTSKYLLADDVRFLPIDARMTTSTFDPVKGITSQSDVTGRVMTYNYDNFNRLRLIKDNDGNILERYKYHYKGETLNEIPPSDIVFTSYNVVETTPGKVEATTTFRNDGVTAGNIVVDEYVYEGSATEDEEFLDGNWVIVGSVKKPSIRVEGNDVTSYVENYTLTEDGYYTFVIKEENSDVVISHSSVYVDAPAAPAIFITSNIKIGTTNTYEVKVNASNLDASMGLTIELDFVGGTSNGATMNTSVINLDPGENRATFEVTVDIDNEFVKATATGNIIIGTKTSSAHTLSGINQGGGGQ